MAHFKAPKPSVLELPTFFNVDGVVGVAPAQNNREDVLLVQFALKIIAAAPLAETDPDVLVAARAVKLTGVADEATITGIKKIQLSQKKTNPGTIVDGRVSPTKEGYAYGGGLWTIVNLNDSIQHRHLAVWPRIDKIPGCPEELKAMVMRTVVGK